MTSTKTLWRRLAAPIALLALASCTSDRVITTAPDHATPTAQAGKLTARVGHHVLKVGDVADGARGRAARADAPATNTPRTQAGDPAPAGPILSGAGLTISATFDASIDASTRTVINNALAFYNTFSNTQSFSIYFYNKSSGLGESWAWLYSGFTYSQVRSALAGLSQSSDDATALASLPSTSSGLPSVFNNIEVKPSIGRILGFNTPDLSMTFSGSPCPGFTGIGCIGLNVSLANSHGNLTAVIQHEVNELLGLGSSLSGTGAPSSVWPADLFRWSSAGVRSFAPNSSTSVPCSSGTPRAFLSFDGGSTNINEFNNCANGGDYGDWITHTPSQIQDAFTNFSGTPSMTSSLTEARALDVIGYNMAAHAAATMTSPTGGSTLSGSSVTFQWSTGTGALDYWLYVGTSPAASDIYNSNASTTSRSATVTGIPTDGRTIYVRLWTEFSEGWTFIDYTYTAATASSKGAMTSPTAGSTLSGSSVTFQWSAGSGAQDYSLYVGTSFGGSDIFRLSNPTTSTSTSVTGIPTDGRTIYVRLWTRISGVFQFTDYTYTAATINTKAAITSPTAGSTLSGSSVTFEWNTGSGATDYSLYVGTSFGASDIFRLSNPTTSTSTSVSGIPTDGRTIYVRLWTRINGVFQFADYTYTAATINTKAAITSPTAGSTLSGSSVTFEWNTGSGASDYALYVGTSFGGSDIYRSSSATTSTSASVSGIPTDGRLIYVRLWTRIGGVFQSADYTYTAATINTKAAITSPTAGSTLSGSSVTFEWNSGSGASDYALYVGTSFGGSDIYRSSSATTSTSASVSGIPTDGRLIYVRLWTRIGGVFQSADYTYTAATINTKAAITSPSAGSTLSGSSVTFQWNAGSGATSYSLYVGTSPGASDVFRLSNPTTSTSTSVTGIPTDGRTIYVRLWTLISGVWQFTDYTYTAANSTSKAAMTSPTAGSTLSGSSVTFQWNAGSGAQDYSLYVGTTFGGSDIYRMSSPTTSLSAAVTGIPTNGSTIYVRLWTRINGVFQSTDYTYTAASLGSKAAMTSPTAGSTLSGSSVTFQWTAGSGASGYALFVGTGIGESNIYRSDVTTSRSASVTGIPLNGSTIYVRLWTLISGEWQSTDYTYTTPR